MKHIITLSLLIIAVLAIRFLFRKKISPNVTYALWLVVILKLCMPFSLFEIQLFAAPTEESYTNKTQINDNIGQSATNNIQSISSDFPQTTADSFLSNPKDIAAAIPDEGSSHIETSGSGIESSEAVIFPIVSPEKDANKGKIDIDENILSETKDKKMSIKSVSEIIWIGGSAVFALWFAITNAVFSFSVLRDRSKVGKYKGLKVYVSEKIGTPCLYGLIPSIYLTPKAYGSESRKLILRHEFTHLCHGDNIWAFFRIAAIVLLWWNPLIWVAAILSRQDAELACDYSVTRSMNDSGRVNYARVIIDMLPAKRNFVNGFANGSVKERIIMMTKKKKTRMISAVLSVMLIISAVGCSFIGITEKKEPTYDANAFFPGGEVSEAPKIDYYDLISNSGGFETKQIVIEDQHKYYHSVWLEDDIYLYLSDDRSLSGTMKLYLVDISAGKLLDSKTVSIDSFPSQVMYKDGKCIIYNFYYDTENEKPVLECAYEVANNNGILNCSPQNIDLFPHYDSIILSPNGSIKVGKSTDDVNGHGGMDIIRSDGTTERIANNIMLDDDIGGKKADIGDVTGYTPFAFIDDTRFVYRIGGWEWSQGYGIYNTATGEKTEFLEGKGLQTIDADGNFYVWQTSNYEPQNIWRIRNDGTSELIASYSEDNINGVFNLKGVSVTYTNNGFALVSTSEDYENDIYRICSPDLKKVLAEIKEYPNKGTTDLKILDNTLVFVTFSNKKEDIPKYTEGITLYSYDGESVKFASVTDSLIIDEILNEIRSFPSKKLTGIQQKDIKEPIYSMRFEDKIKHKTAVWSNGYLITDDGIIYEHNLNIKKLSEKYFTEIQTSEDIRDFCGLGLVARAGGVWNSKYMTKATFNTENTNIDNIELEVLYIDDGSLNVIFRNKGDENWEYGLSYDIHSYVDGKWYDIPDISHSAGMNVIDSYLSKIACEVLARRDRHEAYSLPDRLPDGKYRIAVHGLMAEFEIDSARESELTVYDNGESTEDSRLLNAIQNAVFDVGLKEVKESGWKILTDQILLGTEQQGSNLTAYVYMAYQIFTLELDTIQTPGGLFAPVELNFVRKGENYELKEYNLADTTEKTEEYFPKELHQMALAENNRFLLSKSVYCDAIEYFAGIYPTFDDEQIIDTAILRLIENAEKHDQDNPLAYLDTDPKEYLELLYYDKYTLSYVFKHFLAGGQEGTKGELLKNLMIDITGWESSAEDSPQEYFTSHQISAVDLYNFFEDKSKMKATIPNEYLLGSLTHSYFDYYGFESYIPNENAVIVKESVITTGGNLYLYLCKDRNDDKKVYVYYTKDFGRTIGSIDIKLPNDIEYDTVEPIFAESGAGSGEIQLGFALQNDGERIFILYDNFDYSNTEDWHIFKYRGIADENALSEKIAVLIRDYKIIAAYKERRSLTEISFDDERYSIITESENKCVLRVKLKDEWGEIYEFPCEYINGKWIFTSFPVIG